MDPTLPPYLIPHPYLPPITTGSTAPPATPAATEAQNNNNTTHVAANPSPPPPNPTSNHPPYAEMIYAAITALKEKDGSSKRAIAKYIERAYSGLPTTHSALLTHHLKRLKNNGLLFMVKKSYKLPGSDASLPSPAASAADTTTTLPTAGPTRGRGRPPKPKPTPDQPIPQQPSLQQPIPIPQQPILNQSIPQQPNLQQPTLHQPISVLQQPTLHQPFPIHQQPSLQQPNPIPIPQQPSLQQPNFQAFPEPANSQPMLVALGLVDEPAPASVGRRPGRPRKVFGVGVGQGGGGGPVSAKRGRGRPPGPRLPKKRPGRPPKPKSVSAVGGPNGLVKRGRGRPSKAEPKSVFFPYATNVPLMGAFEQNNNVPSAVVPQQPPSRRRGRPKKDAAAAAASVGGSVSGKRRGRPPRLPGVELPKRSTTGRPVGRPKKKNASVATTKAPDPNLVANGEYKRKLEYFKFKVGQAVGALKPYLTNDVAVSAIAAIQELEGLATMDIGAPLNIEAQQPPPVLQS